MAYRFKLIFLWIFIFTSMGIQGSSFRRVQADFLEEGSQANRNYIGNSGIDVNTKGWVAYDDNSVTPIDCAGGSADSILTAQTTVKLRGDKSLQYNVVGPLGGEGFSYDFKLDPADAAVGNTQRIEFDYQWATPLQNEFKVYVYNIDSAKFEAVSQQSFDSIKNRFYSSFIPTVGDDDYRLCVHKTVATSSGAGNYFDNFFVGPKEAPVSIDSGPIGEIISAAIPSSSPPDDFLFCNGAAISRTIYADLFDVIGTIYGAGNGSTTFNLPNLQGMFLRGTGSKTVNGRTKTGPSLGIDQEDAFQGHKHNASEINPLVGGIWNGSVVSGYTLSVSAFSSNQMQTSVPISDGSNGTPRTSSETRPSSSGVNYFIRYRTNKSTISSDFGNRVVAFNAYKTTAGAQTATASSDTVINFETVTGDTTASFSTNAYTIPESGWYHARYNLSVSMGATATSTLNTGMTLNSTSFSNVHGTQGQQSFTANTGYTFQGSVTKFFNSGDILRVVVNNGSQNVTINGTGGTNHNSSFSINKIQSPQTLFGNARAPTVQRFTSGSGTYTTPNGVRWIKVKIVGGGGGGGGGLGASGASGGAGGNGGTSTFGTSLLTATGGGAGSGATTTNGGAGGVGGVPTVNSPAIALITMSGARGNRGGISANSNSNPGGGAGGSNLLGGAGASGMYLEAGFSGVANTGAGAGGGGPNTNNGTMSGGGGGGSGAYIEAVIFNPEATYSYSVATSGTPGSGGGSGLAGGTGGSGVIIVEEHYF